MIAAEPTRPGLVSIVAAILLPPLGVFLGRGLSRDFWITVVLTLVGWVPGVVFALIVLLRPDLLPDR